jgi:CheY-like chemotaxis protein
MFVLYVKDTGIGIEESKRDIIFQPFRQAEEGNSRKFDGSGLGLAIVAGITELLSGKISVESETGKGSAFYVTLPVNSIKDETNTETLTEQKEMATKRIVSFEDNKASVEYLNIVMEMLGYEHVNFDNAKKGIEYLRNNRADLVLMDIQMPEMDGYEATRRIKKEFPGLPVIIQTAYAMQSDKEKAFEAGCDDYLSKPLSLKILKEKIVNTVESIEI